MRHIAAKDFNGITNTFNVLQFPDECPFCHKGIDPLFWGPGYHDGDMDDTVPSFTIEALFLCPREGCRKTFIGYYSSIISEVMGCFRLDRVAPGIRKTEEFSQTIQEISPSFVRIYQQSYTAEQEGLDQICGVGYRKSLEYLVKDYAIKKHQGDESKIKETALGKCIEDYITDARIKSSAKLGTWLGNDETHYVRKWETKDVQDLKGFIRRTVLWMELEVETENAEKEMVHS